jgi:hypothetical protein
MDTLLIEEACRELKRLLALEAERLEPEVRQEILQVIGDLNPANLVQTHERLKAHPTLSVCLGRALANLTPRLSSCLTAHLRIDLVRQMQGLESRALPRELAQTLQELRRARGLCPSPEEIVEYEQLTLADRRKHAIHPHVRVCSKCRLLVLGMTEPSSWEKHFRTLFGCC